MLQVGVAPDLLLCHFHTQAATILSRDAALSQQSNAAMGFSAAVDSLKAAAESLAQAAAGRTCSSSALKEAQSAISACRGQLDEAMRRRQQDTLRTAFPGTLCFATEADACRPFVLRPPPCAHASESRAAGETDRSSRNLQPLPSLTVEESSDVNHLFPWVASFPDASEHHAQAVVLHMIERWYFGQACRQLGRQHAQPACEVAEAGDLLALYSRKLLRFEAVFSRTADSHTEVLSVELRSRESLVTWIAMCLAHQQAASEWPELLKFALPVRADAPRHLVLSDSLAAAALKAVVAYVSSVNCSSTDGPVFSTRTDATMKLAAAFARGSEALTKKLNEEIRISVARIDEHWDAIVEKQQRVRDVQEKLSVAQDRLANARIDKEEACRTLDKKIREAEARADALKSKTAHHRSHVISTIMEFYNQSRTRSAADAEKDQKVKAANAAWRKSHAYVQQLRSERKHGCPAGGSTAGEALQRAQQDIAAAEQQVQRLQVDLEDAQTVPARVWQALPDCRLPGPARDAARAILFFLHPEHAGSLPLLQQLCCAAQQGIIPWPLQSPAGGWDASGFLAREPAHTSWREFYHTTHATAEFQHRIVLFDTDEDPEQLNLYTTFHAPAPGELGPSDVMSYRSKADGVWFPKAAGLRLVWRGGPVARYSSAVSALDPFADCSGSPEAAAQAFTEPGRYSSWLLAHARGPSRLCQQPGASASGKAAECGCSGPRSFGGRTIPDRPLSFDLTRGNRSLTQQTDRHPAMRADQWLAFAGLRAYPHTQLRRLCVALRDRTLLLDSPQVSLLILQTSRSTARCHE